ncbi:peptidyl-prolyl cis-trans isomerase FKBP7 isoform X4 [Conger conger]|nr:peptidyl-prolyl cis-trans isomerase FKBP7 isoform X4 [Conger conger]
MPENCIKKSKRGDLMNAHYDGFLAKDGSQFYCSRTEKDGHPKWFVLGVGQVIKGLDIGMDGMCAGEKRKLIIPPSLGYGQQGNEKVPPNSTLMFEIELYSVSRGPRSMEAFMEMDLDKDRALSKTEVRKSLMAEYEKGGTRRDDSFYDAIIADIFRTSDHNGDGMISTKEYNVYEHDEL